MQDYQQKTRRIGIIGMGYVGLPLAVLFATRYRVVGFDVKESRIEELRRGIDRTGEVDRERLENADLLFTGQESELDRCGVFIVTVPTPVDAHHKPDLSFVESATETAARHLQPGGVVVYESTVYPGTTEEVCVPILEKVSGLRWKEDLFVGYSPERVNPGDRQHTVDRIVKVVSGDSAETTGFLADLYGSVIPAGIHQAPDIKTAEAAKVIENTQRDLNIALMNELAIIFSRMNIRTLDVLAAAATKWNFLRFAPGLVGGHCIGVDPYYLTFKAESLGYHPEVILAGRRINDGMGKYVAEATVKRLIKSGKTVKGSRILILGITFKEDIPDVRNTRVIDICRELGEYDTEVFVYDPQADGEEVLREYGLRLAARPEDHAPYDAVVVAVRHQVFADTVGLERIRSLQNGKAPVLIDVKSLYGRAEAERLGIAYWEL
jgi:UDP-N-acetyl-D-galactosamine dehydrogenase